MIKSVYDKKFALDITKGFGIAGFFYYKYITYGIIKCLSYGMLKKI